MPSSQTKKFYGIKNTKKHSGAITRQQAARNFVNTWSSPDKGAEDKDRQTFWIDLLEHVYGVQDYAHYLDFERDVLVNSHKKHIDVFIPSTKVMIEMKGKNRGLDEKIPQSDGTKLTPFEQAHRYAQHLPHKDNPRWIIVCNFNEIRIHDMNDDRPAEHPTIIRLQDLPNKIDELEFLVDVRQQNIIDEKKLSVNAGNLVAKIYNVLSDAYSQHADIKNKTIQQSLNILIVRLVFLLYADDTGILGDTNIFQKFIARREPQDIRRDLIVLFQVLNQKDSERDPFLTQEFLQFSYVNGGMFENEDVIVPQFTQELKDLIVNEAGRGFDWSNISPTIFGAVFESTLNPETRREVGMHYTSVENIHKVIDPLFLDNLTAHMNQIKNMPQANKRREAAKEFQEKLGHMKFLDPACGSGNFLTETYLCLRRMENECLRIIYGQETMLNTFKTRDIIKVHIQNYYGIEINDFAVSVARTAMWIAESQMFDATKNIVYAEDDFLPLDSNDSIYEGNALRMDWNSIVRPFELDYIMGNPPFVGARLMDKEQKKDILSLFEGTRGKGNLDYVTGWYIKAGQYICKSTVQVAFVSTNSITQGEQVSILWGTMVKKFGVAINFAYRTFIWNNEAMHKAHVHCVIIGFASELHNIDNLYIYDSTGLPTKANHINGYLIDSDDIFISNHSRPLSHTAPIARSGNQPIDDGNYLFTENEYLSFIKKNPETKKFFRKWIGAREFINGINRYCLWLGNSEPSEYRRFSSIMNIVDKVRQYRNNSKRKSTLKLANYPTHFQVETIEKKPYLVLPLTSSRRREYVPVGYMSPNVLPSNLVTVISDASLFHFGVITSKVFMIWMATICGRLKSDYRITKNNVYNNFPWPPASEKERQEISDTARRILKARKTHSNNSLADLYDPSTMPVDLRKAHKANDKAVLKAYGLNTDATESDMVQHLFKMYEKLTNNSK